VGFTCRKRFGEKLYSSCFQVATRFSYLLFIKSLAVPVDIDYHMPSHLPISISLRRNFHMKISARNVLKGKVKKIIRGAVNSEVSLELPGGSEVVSIITNSSVDRLGLKEGKEAYAVIKASSVMISVD